MAVVVITGGGSGIGAAAARRFAADGWSVVITGRRPEPIEQVAEEIGGLAIVADQSLEADCARVIEQTIDRYGRIDAIVANAGIEAMGSAEELDLPEWRKVMAVNVDGVLMLARAGVPALRTSRGSFTVVSSAAGLAAGPHYAAYVTSKTAVLGLVRSMAVDLGPEGIRVNAMCPGWTATEMSEREAAELAEALGVSSEEAERRLVEHLPLGRMADPAEIAGCLAFLASPDAAFVTGTTLLADGGGSAVDVGTLAYSALEP
ncbi:MAG: SDR family oxidoreductase [Actinomycetota bacterium]|jgi:meso-butanediol dehydrogenase / (S,S)-butanediol dehydrogenase / diacetyl reductase|nr:SDR family oxidoreductase [Actinomycetota bacterium]